MARYTHAVKERVHAKTGGKCFYCGTADNITLDHIKPRSRGGYDRVSNLLPACKMCNSFKGSNTLQEFRLIVAYQFQQYQAASGIKARPLKIKFYGETCQTESSKPSSTSIGSTWLGRTLAYGLLQTISPAIKLKNWLWFTKEKSSLKQSSGLIKLNLAPTSLRMVASPTKTVQP